MRARLPVTVEARHRAAEDASGRRRLRLRRARWGSRRLARCARRTRTSTVGTSRRSRSPIRRESCVGSLRDGGRRARASDRRRRRRPRSNSSSPSRALLSAESSALSTAWPTPVGGWSQPGGRLLGQPHGFEGLLQRVRRSMRPLRPCLKRKVRRPDRESWCESRLRWPCPCRETQFDHNGVGRSETTT